MATENRAEVMDFIERFNFNLGNAIECIARSDCKPASGIIAELEKAHWYLEREIKRIKTRPQRNRVVVSIFCYPTPVTGISTRQKSTAPFC